MNRAMRSPTGLFILKVVGFIACAWGVAASVGMATLDQGVYRIADWLSVFVFAAYGLSFARHMVRSYCEAKRQRRMQGGVSR